MLNEMQRDGCRVLPVHWHPILATMPPGSSEEVLDLVCEGIPAHQLDTESFNLALEVFRDSNDLAPVKEALGTMDRLRIPRNQVTRLPPRPWRVLHLILPPFVRPRHRRALRNGQSEKKLQRAHIGTTEVLPRAPELPSTPVHPGASSPDLSPRSSRRERTPSCSSAFLPRASRRRSMCSASLTRCAAWAPAAPSS